MFGKVWRANTARFSRHRLLSESQRRDEHSGDRNNPQLQDLGVPSVDGTKATGPWTNDTGLTTIDSDSGASTIKVSDTEAAVDAIPSAAQHLPPWCDWQPLPAMPTPPAETYQPPSFVPLQKRTIWSNIGLRARQDPMAFLGVVAACIVLPFVIRGATR